MIKEFIPNINKNVFTNTILNIQDGEGNNVTVVKKIKSKIEGYKMSGLYDAFIYTCKEYKIDFKCYEINDDKLISFKVIIRHNGLTNYALVYHDSNKDITIDLARKLYAMLRVQILNEVFINSVKSKTINP